MTRQVRNNYRGSALLETTLFVPVLLFFLFVVIDGGLALTERAGLINALRTSLHSEGLHSKEAPFLEVAPGGELELNSSAPDTLAALATAAWDSALGVQGYEAGDPPPTLSITLSLVVLDIDAQSGALLDYNVAHSVTLPFGPQHPDLPQHNPNFPYLSREEFLAQKLSLHGGSASPYAVPAIPAYQPDGSPGEEQYLDRSVALYGEITALTRGVNPAFAKSVLGNFYSLQEQQLVLNRTIFR